jgi:hypothetical protein
VLQPIIDDLPPTATYRRRSFVYIADGSGFVCVPDSDETVPGLGKLTIRLRKARSEVGKEEIDSYAVAELPAEYPGTRLFLLLNLSDPSQGEPYKVTVGGVNLCRCQAGRCKVPSGCKHRDALARVIELGGLDPADSEVEAVARPADRPWRYDGFRLGRTYTPRDRRPAHAAG